MALTSVQFFSQALGMCVTCDVILPQRKDCARDVKLPVLYLLHGAFGNHYDWIRRTSIERYAAPYGLAVVMPSAQNSFYADMAHGGSFYTYISDELPRAMRGFFNFSDKREDNYIAGLSMGGTGSLMIGLSKPEQYSAIGCLSSGMTNFFPDNLDPALSRLVYGDKVIEGSYMDSAACAKRIAEEKKPAPRIYQTCGKDDFLLETAHKTRDFLRAFPGDPFSYVYEEDEGSHTWEYWDEHIRHFLSFLNLPVTDQYC